MHTFSDPHLLSVIKEEVPSRPESDQGEEEMEVDSADDAEEDQKGGLKGNSTFTTLSTLSTLKPGKIFISLCVTIILYNTNLTVFCST